MSLTEVERALVGHVERGTWLDLAGDEPVDEASMRAWDESRIIRAGVIRDIALGRLAADPDPHGLRVRGARIDGRLDLDNVTTAVHIELSSCLFDQGLTAVGAYLGSLVLGGAWLEHPTEPAVDLRRSSLAYFALEKASVRSANAEGAIILSGSHVRGEATCKGATIRNGSGPALHGDSLQVEQGMHLSGGFTATGSSNTGAVRLVGARIGGDLDCEDAIITNDSGPALKCYGIYVDQALSLSGGFTATGDGDEGSVGLQDAQIGDLDCTGATMINESGPALIGDRLHVDRSLFLHNGFTARGSGHLGAVRLPSAHVGGQLACVGATMTNESGPALLGDRLRVDQGLVLRDGFVAHGSGDLGAVRLPGGHIRGQFDCAGATMTSDSGPALIVDGLRVDQGMFLIGGFSARGSGDLGAVRLTGAHIAGQVACTDASITNDSGPALHGDGLRAGDGVLLNGEFDARGTGEQSAVRLPGAQIAAQLWCQGTIHNDTGPALDAERVRIDDDCFLDVRAVGGGDHAAVNLGGMQVKGQLSVEPDAIGHTLEPRLRMNVDGLQYSGLPQMVSTEEWLRLLRDGTPEYAAQPYQQLAGALRAAGHDREARRVLMAQRRDQIRRWALTGRGERAWARMTGVLLGYGYQPWRALIGLFGAIVVSAVLAVVLGGHGGLAHQVSGSGAGAHAAGCSVVDRVGVGVDLGTPLIATGARDRCGTTDSATGQVLTVSGWVLRLVAWAFATLFIAGFTGAVRKT